MPPENPWGIPHQLDRGDEHEDKIYLAVGKALSEWEYVEGYFAELFAAFVGANRGIEDSEHALPAIRAYGAIISFKSRADMVDAAGKVYFFLRPNADLEKQFRDIIKECRGFSSRRNDIAHGMAQFQMEQREPPEIEKYRGFFLFPGLWASKKYPLGQRPAYAYTSAQIYEFAEKFEQLRFSIAGFESYFRRAHEAWPEKPPQP